MNFYELFALSNSKIYSSLSILDVSQVPEIDIESPEGDKPEDITGQVEFKNVHFQYPSRPDVKVNRVFP